MVNSTHPQHYPKCSGCGIKLHYYIHPSCLCEHAASFKTMQATLDQNQPNYRNLIVFAIDPYSNNAKLTIIYFITGVGNAFKIVWNVDISIYAWANPNCTYQCKQIVPQYLSLNQCGYQVVEKPGTSSLEMDYLHFGNQ